MDNNFPWFGKVEKLECYKAYDIADKDAILEWFTRFENLQEFKGVSDEAFFPLERFPTHNKKIPRINWTHPENEALRK